MATSISQGFPKFNINKDVNNVYTPWEKYVSRFETYLTAMAITEENQQRALLLHLGGDEIHDVFDSLTEPGTTFATLKAAFEAYFKPRSNEIFDIWTLQKLARLEGESIHNYHLRLVNAEKNCNFTDNNISIQTQLILAMRNETLRRYCFTNKNIDAPKILSQVKLLEEVSFQVDTIQGTSSTKQHGCRDLCSTRRN